VEARLIWRQTLPRPARRGVDASWTAREPPVYRRVGGGPMTDETNIPPKSKVRLPKTIKKLRKRLRGRKKKGTSVRKK
jgi:hypothetical protein